ncbi:alpha/beta hydrolase [Mycobacterium sp. OTB74]|jgi:pimeloyl-ACP methyl ester carboxylesterase|uniref:alpha/beta hydrolase n=1 Tax=Mycobacterium sp. OTB74 TaxID=1853452 RepID=UPI002475F2BB|nr:alpha/beta hydrolase [Mycobacterium sp. OTB74]MDH6244964.1 pimeloyl-ACP methyl ester carboxylesterase [Mycobacterium sp. OTB74]
MPTIETVDGFDAHVELAGPEGAPAVVVLAADGQMPSEYNTLCKLLHTASLRTMVIAADARLSVNSVVGIMDTLEVRWALLVGDRDGAELAWRLAANRLDRFTALVVIDRGHPRSMDGPAGDAHCPPVEVNTTAVVTTAGARQVVAAGQRFVYGDFRLVDMIGRRATEEFTAQLANEVVLRSSTW